MYSYDEGRDILCISQIPVRHEEYVYQSSPMYESYCKYLKRQVFIDLGLYVLKPLNEAISGMVDKRIKDEVLAESREEGTYKVKGREVVEDVARVRGDSQKLVKMSLSNRYLGESKPFTILRVPGMDKYGVIHRRARGEALIGELVQSDDITFDKQELKIMTKEGRYINIVQGAYGPRMDFGGYKYPAGQVLAALATAEGLDAEGILKQVQSLPCMRSIKPAKYLEWQNYAYGALKEPVLDKKLYDPSYSLENVRNQMNETLGLQNRAVGERLEMGIKDSAGNWIAKAGTVITKDIVEQAMLARMTTLDIEGIPNLTGMKLAEDLQVVGIRKGSEIIPEIEDVVNELLPDNKGKYVNCDIMDIKNNIVIPKYTELYPRLLEFLVYNCIRDIRVQFGASKETERDVRLYRQIISNRSVIPEDIGYVPEHKTEYVYVNEDGSIDESPHEFLTAYDLLAMLSLFDSLVVGNELGAIASKDLGFRKKVLLAGELFSKAMQIAGKKFVGKKRLRFRELMGDVDNITQETRVGFGDGELLEQLFYGLSQEWWKALRELKVVQDIDYTNPLSFYSSLEKINTITKSKHAVTEGMRGMTLGHIGRVCPYEIPSGTKLGVVNTRTPFCKIENGILKAPYRKVLHLGKRSRLSEDVTYLSVAEEERYRIGDILSLIFDEKGFIVNSDRVLAKIPVSNVLEKMAVEYVDVAFLDYVSVDPQQNISLACSIIPFMGADDAARVTFEISMSKQAKALLYNEVPIVLTSAYYDVPRKSPYFMIHAEHDGTVLNVYGNCVEVLYEGEEKTTVYDYKPCEITHGSVILRQLEVSSGQQVRAGDILVSSNFVKDGLLAMGRNVLVCYVPVGYNYEDGVFASDRLRHNLTTYTPEKETEMIPKAFASCTAYPPNRFTYVAKDDVLFRKLIRMRKTGDQIKKTSRATKIHGFIMDVNQETDPYSQRSQFVTSAVGLDYTDEGDKMANRHGNKGVTPALRSAEEMPSFVNGEFVDICYNPAGVASRMNVGQVLECNLGFAGYILNTKFRSDSFNGASTRDIQRILSFAWRLAHEDDPEKVIDDFPEFPVEWRRKRLEYLDWIKSWKGAFNEDGTAYLYNPKTGKMFETPVVVGINYIHKLVQEIQHKIHARSGYLREDYVRRSSAPTEGAAKGGGQRMGEMELAALAAYGASEYIQELMNERGDNPVKRCNLTSDAIFSGEERGNQLRLDEYYGVRRSTEEFVHIMEVLGIDIQFDGELHVGNELDRRMVYSSEEICNTAGAHAMQEEGGKNPKSFDVFKREFFA